MYKAIEAYYENGKIFYKEAMPAMKRAKLFITIIEEEPHEIHKLFRFRGILKEKINGLEYQRKFRSEWD